MTFTPNQVPPDPGLKAAVAEAPTKVSKVTAFFDWAVSPRGRHELGSLLAAGVAVYTALHRAASLSRESGSTHV